MSNHNQLSRKDLAGLSADEIVQAGADGRLRALLSGRDPVEFPDLSGKAQLDHADLQHLTPAEIVAAEDAGRLDVLTGRRTAEEAAASDDA